MKTSLIALAASLVLGAASAFAQVSGGTTADSHSGHHPAGSAQASDLSDGEITRWDPRTLRITLRHGEIKNLSMPPMTMVFRVQDANMVGDLKPGDKVRFRAEQANNTYQVTRIEKAP